MPESRHNSIGRMSAPCHDRASSASKLPQQRYQLRLRRLPAVAARACSFSLIGVDMRSTVIDLFQSSQLLVDLGQFGFFVCVRQGRIGINLVALAKHVQLTDGLELIVG